MKLISIKLRNFQGVSNFEMIADGKDCFVYGQNGAGKTTIPNAVNYLLCDKDSLGQSTFEIKPTTLTGSHSDPIICEVEAVFLMNGEEITLKKVMSEDWTRSRGALDHKLTGHTTSYFVNGNKRTAKDFAEEVLNMAKVSAQVLRVLTNTNYFNEQIKAHETKDKRTPMQIKRDILFDMAPKNITNGVILDSMATMNNKDDILFLTNTLNKVTIEDKKISLKARQSAIKKEKDECEGAIKEQLRVKPEITGNNSQAIIGRLITLREALDKKNAEIAAVQAGGGMATLKNSLAAIELEISKLQNEMAEATRGKAQGLRDELSAEKDLLAEQKRHLQALSAEAGLAAEELKNQKETKAALVSEYKQLISGSFSADTCPTCKQTLPADQVEELRANFNESRANAKAKNIEKGTACAARITAIEKRASELAGLIVKTAEDIGAINVRIVALSEKIAGAAQQTDAMPPALVKELSARDAMLKEIREMAEGNTGTIQKLAAEKSEIQSSIEEQEKQLAKIEQALEVDTRVAELKEQESKLSREFEALERQLFLIESFIKAKCSMLTDSINSKFKLVKFNLFRDQLNGGVEEICEATVNGVPYKSSNHGARIQAGLDIIETVGNHYGFHPVIFVDNRESVTDLPEVSAQVISLVVSPEDKKLRVVQV